ncbi:MAG: ferric reductase-like transmembrane domain-containing protein [Steroidobacter sp.]
MNRASAVWVRKALPPAICAITLSTPLVVWLSSTGDLYVYFTRAVPPGQTLYVLSKFFALAAIVMFWFQCMSALAKDTPVLRGFFRLSPPRHAIFGMATFAAVLTHVLLFVAASAMRTSHVSLDVLTPRFDHGFYRTYLSLGAIAFWILLIVVFAGWKRLRNAPRWRWAHRLGFAVFALAFLHGVNVGSETRFGFMKYTYAFIGLSVGAAVASRLWVAAQRYRRSAPGAGTSHARTQSIVSID